MVKGNADRRRELARMRCEHKAAEVGLLLTVSAAFPLWLQLGCPPFIEQRDVRQGGCYI